MQFTSLGRPDPHPGTNKKRSERFRCKHCQWSGAASSPSRLNDHLTGCRTYQLVGPPAQPSTTRDEPENPPAPRGEPLSAPHDGGTAASDDHQLPPVSSDMEDQQSGPTSDQAANRADSAPSIPQTPADILEYIATLQLEHRRALSEAIARDRAHMEERMQGYTTMVQAQQHKYDDDIKARRTEWTQELEALAAAHEKDLRRAEAGQKRQMEIFAAMGKMLHECQEQQLRMTRDLLQRQLEKQADQIKALQNRFEGASMDSLPG